MNYKRLVVIFILLMPSICLATPASQLRSILHSLNSIQASFRQTLFDGRGRAMQTTSGTMSIARPGRFRWKVMSPSQQLIVTDGKTLWVYDKDLKQVSVQPLKTEGDDTPAMILSGSSNRLFQAFGIEKVQGWFILTPKVSGTAFRNIKLLFDGNRLVQMDLADNIGQTSKIRFSNIRINRRLQQNLFKFTPPAGVDVIRG